MSAAPRSGWTAAAASLAFTLAAAAPVALAAVPLAVRADDTRVRSITIEGAKWLDADDIKRRLATSEPGMWPWSTAPVFDPVLWEEDLRRIVRLYEAHGFYGTRVAAAELERRPDGLHLRVRVEEAPPTQIASVEVTGLDGLPRSVAAKVRDRVRLEAGERFREGDWVVTKADVERALRDAGYANATAGGTARVDAAAHEARIALEIEPGRRYRFGDLLLATEDDSSYPPRQVLGYARAILPEGAWFSQGALEQAQRRLFELGIYEGIAVTAGGATSGSDRLPVVIDVREAAPTVARLGGGVGTTPGRSEVRAAGEWVDRNFGGGLRSLRLAGRAGWAFVPGVWDVVAGEGSRPTREGPFARLQLDAAQPQPIGPAPLQLFASLEAEQELREAYEYRSARGELGAGWRVSDLVDVRASWALDLYALHDTKLLGRGAPEAALGCVAPCRLGYLEQEITVGRRRGYREGAPGRELSLRLREGVPLLGSTVRFVSAELEGILHVPISSRVELAARAGAGTVVPLAGDRIPIVLRLFSGGGTMRGYGAQRLAPLLLVPGPGGSTQVVATGGKGLLETSLEVRANIGASFGLAAFVDGGAVTSQSFDPRLLAKQLQVAPGVGVRYRTALGPLRADLATIVPLGRELPVAELPGAQLDPEVGRRAAREHKCCSMHISIGESF